MAQAPMARPIQYSPDLTQIAATYQLGTPLGEHKAGLATPLKVMIASIGVLLLLAGILTGTGVGILLDLIGLVLIIYPFIVTPVFHKGWRVVVGSEGLVFLKGSKAQVARWSQLESFNKRVVGYYFLFFRITAVHSYTLKEFQGQKFRIGDFISRVEELGNHIDMMVTHTWTPRAIAACTAGNIVPFNKLSVSMQGIHRGKTIYPWNEIQSVSIRQVRIGAYSAGLLGAIFGRLIAPYSYEYLVIERTKGVFARQLRFQVSSIPNISMFLAVIRQLSGGRL